MGVVNRSVGLSLICALLASPVGPSAQAGPPPLPQLALDTYPPAARDAIARVHQAAIARPSDAGAVRSLAETLHAWDQWEAAHQVYVRCQALSPRSLECHYLDAVVLRRLALFDDAARQFKQAVSLESGYLPARVGLAETTFEAGALDESRRLFETLVGDGRAAPAAELGLGRLDAAAGDHNRAIAHFDRAIALFPEFGAAYYGLALSYRALGRTADAERALAQHAQFGARWPALEDPLRDKVLALRDDPAALVARGVKLAEAGDVAGAISAHESALRGNPSLAQAHVNLINLYGRAQNWSKAEEHYGRAVALAADLTDAHYDYGVILGLQEKWDSAAAAYSQTLALNPAHAQAHNNLGQILERRQEFRAASEEYRQALDAQPTFRLARFNLGRMLLALGENDQAIVELTKLSQPVDAETPRYMFGLSAAYIRVGRKDEAVKWALEAKRLAMQYGQKDLAAIIDRDLAKLK
jgi:tetratricopeptide (TPR) repeat protein